MKTLKNLALIALLIPAATMPMQWMQLPSKNILQQINWKKAATISAVATLGYVGYKAATSDYFKNWLYAKVHGGCDQKREAEKQRLEQEAAQAKQALEQLNKKYLDEAEIAQNREKSYNATIKAQLDRINVTEKHNSDLRSRIKTLEAPTSQSNPSQIVVQPSPVRLTPENTTIPVEEIKPIAEDNKLSDLSEEYRTSLRTDIINLHSAFESAKIELKKLSKEIPNSTLCQQCLNELKTIDTEEIIFKDTLMKQDINFTLQTTISAAQTLFAQQKLAYSQIADILGDLKTELYKKVSQSYYIPGNINSDSRLKEFDSFILSFKERQKHLCTE